LKIAEETILKISEATKENYNW